MNGTRSAVVAPWLERWRLTPDGEPQLTHSSSLTPVRTADGATAMHKISSAAEERAGADVMVWWTGEGAARVLAHKGEALLLERASGSGSLAEMSRAGRDDEATEIICATIERLHAPRRSPPPALMPLEPRFSALFRAAEQRGGLLARAAETARRLFENPREVVPLHGDVHHDNVLDFDAAGWLAIDSKGLIGERAFDYANIFRSPDQETALVPGRLARRLEIVSRSARLDPRRLLEWAFAFSALSAVWKLEDDDDAELGLSVTEAAAAELDR